jgi:hypothetical protein
MIPNRAKKVEFGDFQTPESLAIQSCLAFGNHAEYKTIIEPTCGKGTFLFSALERFKGYEAAYGIEINSSYVLEAEKKIQKNALKNVNLVNSCFFDFNWDLLLKNVNDPILIIGNPPWVTNSALGSLDSKNLPAKCNFKKFKGIDAITGKSNFDISEWMLLQFMEWLNGRTGTLAVLCKTSVARKVLKQSWENGFQLKSSSIRSIDAKYHFKASVDACFLVCEFLPEHKSKECVIFDSLDTKKASHSFGVFQNQLIANVKDFQKYLHLFGKMKSTWRSGIKHDCSAIMELSKTGDCYTNGLGEVIDIETHYLYPMLKSSDVNNGCKPRKWMIVTQEYIGQDTSFLKKKAPKTWSYLEKNKSLFEKRKSSIYNNKPLFSIFGVGDYSFAPWKICISGLYKNLNFKLVNTFEDKPVVVDDTVYFLPCFAEADATILYTILTSKEATGFYQSLIFWDTKRPVTADVLNHLKIEALLKALGLSTEIALGRVKQLQLI